MLKRPRLALLQKNVLVLDASAAKVPGIIRLALPPERHFAYFHVRSSEDGSALGYHSDDSFVPLAVFADRHQADTLLAALRAELFWLRPSFTLFAKKTAMVLVASLCVLFVLLLIVSALNQYNNALPAPPPGPLSLEGERLKPGDAVDADSKLTPPPKP